MPHPTTSRPVIRQALNFAHEMLLAQSKRVGVLEMVESLPEGHKAKLVKTIIRKRPEHIWPEAERRHAVDTDPQTRQDFLDALGDI